MKNNRLYFSSTKTHPKVVFDLQTFFARKKIPVEYVRYFNDHEGEKSMVNWLAATYLDELVKQQKSIKSLETPVFTCVDDNNNTILAIGPEAIKKLFE